MKKMLHANRLANVRQIVKELDIYRELNFHQNREQVFLSVFARCSSWSEIHTSHHNFWWYMDLWVLNANKSTIIRMEGKKQQKRKQHQSCSGRTQSIKSAIWPYKIVCLRKSVRMIRAFCTRIRHYSLLYINGDRI